jgi:hypothetical protein
MLKIIGTNQSYQSATNEEDNTDNEILLHEFLEQFFVYLCIQRVMKMR